MCQHEPIDISEFQAPPKPPLELKPLPTGLRYVFLHGDTESPVIINDNLSDEESRRLISVLEKHRSVFGFSLRDLKGISPNLCTHRIPVDSDIPPTREPQRRLNNAMREVVKKEVLKLLHAGIIYLEYLSCCHPSGVSGNRFATLQRGVNVRGIN